MKEREIMKERENMKEIEKNRWRKGGNERDKQ